MTLGEFRALTANLPDNIEMVQGQRRAEFEYESIDTVETREIELKDGKLKASEKCLVLEQD